MVKPNNKEETKVTFGISKELWKQFTLKVIEKHGTRMNSAILVKFIENYVSKSR